VERPVLHDLADAGVEHRDAACRKQALRFNFQRDDDECRREIWGHGGASMPTLAGAQAVPVAHRSASDLVGLIEIRSTIGAEIDTPLIKAVSRVQEPGILTERTAASRAPNPKQHQEHNRKESRERNECRPSRNQSSGCAKPSRGATQPRQKTQQHQLAEPRNQEHADGHGGPTDQGRRRKDGPLTEEADSFHSRAIASAISQGHR